jgi:hypothetical protein
MLGYTESVALAGAEIAWLEDRELDAERLYEPAIPSAQANGFVLNEAVANERAARFYSARGFEKSANAYAMGIVEVEPNIFYICTSNLWTSHESYLHRLGHARLAPGKSVNPEVVVKFTEPVCGLNGSCLIASNIILIADCFASLIWRVDLLPDGGRATARVWLKQDSMAHNPGGPMPDQPGVNGLGYVARTHYLYYISTAQKLFMRVRIDADTHDPADEPEFVAGGRMGDDFCIDENPGVAYIATHRQDTIDRVSFDPSENRDVKYSVAGEPFTERLIGPTKGVWGRGPGEYGRVAYFLSDGGIKSPPPDGIVQPAKGFARGIQDLPLIVTTGRAGRVSSAS